MWQAIWSRGRYRSAPESIAPESAGGPASRLWAARLAPPRATLRRWAGYRARRASAPAADQRVDRPRTTRSATAAGLPLAHSKVPRARYPGSCADSPLRHHHEGVGLHHRQVGDDARREVKAPAPPRLTSTTEHCPWRRSATRCLKADQIGEVLAEPKTRLDSPRVVRRRCTSSTKRSACPATTASGSPARRRRRWSG